VSGVLLRGILAGAGRLGADPRALSREAGITARAPGGDSTGYLQLHCVQGSYISRGC
jgi:hypothetical protein